MKKARPMFHVDAFTDTPFGGNPAAVCLLDEAEDAGWAQRIAAEMALAATAFVVLGGDGALGLRWFSPVAELTLCGHGTLSAAHVLFEQNLVNAEVVAFDSLSGTLEARRMDDGWIALDLPALSAERIDVPPGLAEALGVDAQRVSRTRLDLLVELEGEEVVVDLRPDLEKLSRTDARGVIVTAASPDRDDRDFVSRYFAPAIGIPEDAVTGSAHAALGPYWASIMGKGDLTGYQASRRGGYVRMRVPPGGDRLEIMGQAVTVLAGELL